MSQKPSWKHVSESIEGVDKQVYKLTTPAACFYLKKKICSYWKETNERYLFPGPQPVSIERKDFETLRKEKYVVCAKTDGERYFLYCTTIPVTFERKKCIKIKICVLVSRNFDFYIVTQKFINEKIYTKDTLLDGEIIDNKFVIHDSIILSGDNVKETNWENRWTKCNEFLNNFYKQNETNTFEIHLKKFYHLNSIGSLFDEIKELKIKSDGVVFYPMDLPVKYKTQYTLFKWKPPGNHTIDFKIVKSGTIYELFVFHKGHDKKFSEIPESRLFMLGQVKSDIIVEFEVRKKDFFPVKIRTDKTRSNSYLTATKTILNARENIKQTELCDLFDYSILSKLDKLKI